MSLWLSQNQEKSGRAGLRARRNQRRPGTAAPPAYGPFGDYIKQPLMSPSSLKNRKSPVAQVSSPVHRKTLRAAD